MPFRQSRTMSVGSSGMATPARFPSRGAARAAEEPSPEVGPQSRPATKSSRRAREFSAADFAPPVELGSNGEFSHESEMGPPDGTQHFGDDVNCPVVREILSRVGDKWSVRILALLAGGPRRFSEVRRAVPEISQRMLSYTLRGLERDGALVRAVYPTIPPKVEYALSASGRSLLTILDALANWARANRDEIEQSREAVRRREEADGAVRSLADPAPGTRTQPQSVAGNPLQDWARPTARPGGDRVGERARVDSIRGSRTERPTRGLRGEQALLSASRDPRPA